MDYIRFSVDGQRLDYDRKYYSSTDTIDTLYCNFKFETDDLGHILGGWDLPYLWAQFHDENGNVYIKAVDDNVCSVPFDCLRQHKFKMTLFATDTQDYMTCTKRYTTNEIAFKFKGIANINYDGGVSPDEPMPTNWQLLLDRVDDCESTVEGLSQDVSAIGDTVDTLSQDVSTTVGRVDTLSQNVSSMQSTVTELSTELDDESTARENADANLQSLINDEATARASADTRLEGLIDDRYTKAETDTLVNAKQDSLSSSQLAAVNSGLTSSDKTTLDDLSQSVPSIESDISGLDTRVTANASAISGINTTVGELSTGLTDESTARANADTRLEGLISDETAAREQLENEDIPRWFTEESNYRINGDNSLQQNIDTLSTRESNHYSSSMSRMNNLDGRITSNTSTLGAVTSSLGTMSQNITSMQGAIDELNTGLTAESTARANADADLQLLINDETNERTSSYNALQQSINGLGNRISKNTTDIDGIIGYLGSDDVIGLQVDLVNNEFTRLGGAVGLNKGADFDQFEMFGGRRRCNVADDGTINAFYGDNGYAEDGSNGQVMVYQPRFYYMVKPIQIEKQATGYGYHLRKANYFVSDKPRVGFKLHPAFYDENGKPVDYILESAYEGSIYDTSANAYLENDEQVADFTADKLSSIANVRPASGLSQALDRMNLEKIAKNRGVGWHSENINIVSMEQLLMLIEGASFNFQNIFGQGVVFIQDDSTQSCASFTGSTSALGNASGNALATTDYAGNSQTTSGKVAFSYRGKENGYGNIWKFVNGMSLWGDGTMNGGMPYICTDYNYAESKRDGNYEPSGFTVTNASGYVSSFGYSEKYDYTFVPSECSGNSSLPVGDYTYITQNLNGYRIAHLGGHWVNGSDAGSFYWYLYNGVGSRNRYIGGRLAYIPIVK